MADLSKVVLDDIWASSGPRATPDSIKVEAGWQEGEIPPAQYQNWWQNRVDMIFQYLYQKGIPEWDGDREYIKDKSVVVDSGAIWVCQSTHTDRKPIDNNPTFWRKPSIDLSYIPNATDSVYGLVRVQNSLTNTSTTDALSAAQGKVLQDTKLSKSANLSDITSANTARNNLGLKTGAITDINTSTTDSTPGRLIRNGDWGIGGSSISLGTSEDSSDWLSDSNRATGVFYKSSATGGFLNNLIDYSQIFWARTSPNSGGFISVSPFGDVSAGGYSGGTFTGVKTLLNNTNVVQTTGSSTSNVMSQDAITKLMSNTVGGLGTAAYRDVTTSSTDSTSNRVLKVGDWGIGGRSIDLGTSVDNGDWLNDSNKRTGFYHKNSATGGDFLSTLPTHTQFAWMRAGSTGGSFIGADLHGNIYSGGYTGGDFQGVQRVYGMGATQAEARTHMGLGNASTRDVVSNSTDHDATSKVITVGYQGIGNGGISLSNTANLNNYTTPGMYRWGNAETPINAPVSNTAGYLHVIYTSSDSLSSRQVYYHYNNHDIYSRYTIDKGNGWSPWIMSVHEENLPHILSTTNALQAVYPVGSIYMNAKSNTNPSSLLGFGTWSQYAQGRVLVGRGSNDGVTYNRENTGGSRNAIVVSHNHSASSGHYNLSHTHSGTTNNNNVSHTHSGTTSANNRGHTHSGSTNNAGDHTHTLYTANNGRSGPIDNGGGWGWNTLTTSAAGAHTHTVSIGTESQNHTHTFSTGAASANHTHTFTTGSWGGNHNHSITVNSNGSSGTNANMMPYIVVSMWVRTA